MDSTRIIEIIVSVLAGLAALIPLVIELVKYVQKYVKEKNWTKLLEKVMELMKVAETKFAEGAERKEWVMAMLKATASELNYDVDWDAVSDLIDALCDLSNTVNPPAEETEPSEGETKPEETTPPESETPPEETVPQEEVKSE